MENWAQPIATHTLTVGGRGSGDLGLTWAQQSITAMMQRLPSSVGMSPWVAGDVCGLGGLRRVLDAVRIVVERHEALRATFSRAANGELRQTIAAGGRLRVGVYEAGDEPLRPVWEAVARGLAGPPFGPTELPVRAAVIVRHGVPVRTAMAFSHLAVDALSTGLVAAEIGRVTAEPSTPPPACWQITDLLAHEHSEAGQRHADRAAEYWREQLSKTPNAVFPLRAHPSGDAEMLGMLVESKAVAAAVYTLACRYRVSGSAVIFAAFALLVAAASGRPSCTANLTTANRPDAMRRASVGNLFQLLPVTVEVGGTFRDLARTAMAASVQAYRFGHYDPARVGRVRDQVQGDRGVRADLSCVVNFGYSPRSLRGLYGPALGEAVPGLETHAGISPAAIRDLSVVTARSWVGANELAPASLSLAVWWLGEAAVMTLSGSARIFTRDQLSALAGALERLLVEAACAVGRDLTADELLQLVDVEPERGDTGLAYLDGNWVDVRAVGELVRSALPARTSGVFLHDSELVAYLADGGPGLTPRHIHAACLAMLGRERFMMTPQRYVVCPAAPSDPSSLRAWLSMKALVAGPGRP